MRRLNTAMVMDKLAIKSRETLRKMVRIGLLPVPFKDEGSNQNFWLESEIDDYIKKQVAARDK